MKVAVLDLEADLQEAAMAVLVEIAGVVPGAVMAGQAAVTVEVRVGEDMVALVTADTVREAMDRAAAMVMEMVLAKVMEVLAKGVTQAIAESAATDKAVTAMERAETAPVTVVVDDRTIH